MNSHKNLTIWASPVSLSRIIKSRPADSWASKNSYNVIARLAISVLAQICANLKTPEILLDCWY